MNIHEIINTEYFSSEEQEAIKSLIIGCEHRREFRNTIKNINNYNFDVNIELGSLLRYVDTLQLEGLFAIMRAFSSGVGIDQLFTDKFITSLYRLR